MNETNGENKNNGNGYTTNTLASLISYEMVTIKLTGACKAEPE